MYHLFTFQCIVADATVHTLAIVKGEKKFKQCSI